MINEIKDTDKTITYFESAHFESHEIWLKTLPSNRTSLVKVYNGEEARDWVFDLFQTFHQMDEQDLVVVNGLHHMVARNAESYHLINEIVSGLFALGARIMTLNIDYMACDGEQMPFTDTQIIYWLDLTDSEMIPLNRFAVELTSYGDHLESTTTEDRGENQSEA